jgi:hypothetical protein
MAHNSNPTDNGLFSRDFLEDNPDFAFEAFRPQIGHGFGGAPKSFFNFFQNRQPELEREFFGQQGQLAAQGLPPAGSNVDFLRDFPWMQRFLERATPNERGIRFAAPARWLIPR